MQCLCPLRHSPVRLHNLQVSTALFALQGPGGSHLLITLLREIPIAVGKKTKNQFVLTDGPWFALVIAERSSHYAPWIVNVCAN